MINFATYCRAFTAMGSAPDGQNWAELICKDLHPETFGNMQAVLQQGVAGDGRIEVPEYLIGTGRAVAAGTRILTQDGLILRIIYGQEKTIAQINPEIAQYFIAGAFGMAALTGPPPLNQTIISGLNTLYQTCLQEGSACEENEVYRTIAAWWSEIVGGREARNQAQQQNKIREWSTAGEEMRNRINDAEGVWYYRFTDAYDAAMQCMPHTDDYCAARNTYLMGLELLMLAELHPARSRCVQYESVYCSPCSIYYDDRTQTVREDTGCDSGCDGSREECIEWTLVGRDTSAEEAENIATSYCTTTCRQ